MMLFHLIPSMLPTDLYFWCWSSRRLSGSSFPPSHSKKILMQFSRMFTPGFWWAVSCAAQSRSHDKKILVTYKHGLLLIIHDPFLIIDGSAQSFIFSTMLSTYFSLPQERSSTPWCLMSTAWLSTIQWKRFVVRSAWFTKKTRFNKIYPICPGFCHHCENYWIVSQPKLHDWFIRLNLVFDTERPYTKTAHSFLLLTPTHPPHIIRYASGIYTKDIMWKEIVNMIWL